MFDVFLLKNLRHFFEEDRENSRFAGHHAAPLNAESRAKPDIERSRTCRIRILA
jgi:hypothetical protein